MSEFQQPAAVHLQTGELISEIRERKAEAEIEKREQRRTDDYVRRLDLANDRIKREKQERRLSGKLSEPAKAFLAMLENDLLDTAGIKAIPRPGYLIDGLLYKDSLAWIGGESNTFKSFIALDIAARFATGLIYHVDDMPMSGPGKVLVVVAEGGAAYGDRITAWEKKNEQDLIGVAFYPRAIQLADMEVAMPALIAHCRNAEYGLIIFDTQAMCTIGQKENDATDMGVVINVLHQLREATGACILLVHHFGKGADGLRGSTSVYAAATTVVTVKRVDDYTVTLSTQAPSGKQKDARAVDGIAMAMERVQWHGGASLVPARPEWLRPPDRRIIPALEDRYVLILQLLMDTEAAGGLTASQIARGVEEKDPKDGKRPWGANNALSWLDKLINLGVAEKRGSAYIITDLGREAVLDVPK